MNLVFFFLLACQLNRSRLTGVTSPFLLSDVRGKKLTLSAAAIKVVCNAVNITTLLFNKVVDNLLISRSKFGG